MPGTTLKVCNRTYTSYNAPVYQISGTTYTAGTCVKIGSIPIDVQTLIYGATCSISGVSTASSTGVGIIVMALDTKQTIANTSVITFPSFDCILTAVVIPTARGLIGEGKFIFGKTDEGIITDQTKDIGVFLFSETAGILVDTMITVYTKNL